MAEKDLIKTGGSNALLLDQNTITPEYFISHYMEFVPMYIASGQPSRDTLKSYASSIDQFLEWCRDNKRSPLSFHDYQMRYYFSWLFKKGYKKSSMAIKMVHVRCFFIAAVKIGLIKENPCRDIHIPNAQPEERIFFFTPDQLYEICRAFDDEKNDFLRCRDTSILCLMGAEGLRNVEIHRMNRQDINWENGSIFIRGKGHSRYIYPCASTMKFLSDYLEYCPTPDKTGEPFTPMFICDCNRNGRKRISRNGIRFIMNKALEKTGYKKPGISCHVFRHSTGTNLYAATKDLRLVQETLGHRDPKTTARYAHIQERMTKRVTEQIFPHPKNA
ncbi:MAG: tyrosine-type recombinase/integrase [Schwartzia succinivorans]|nr:tyrosine-type recombinase/integrase [Schwartzia succinivorans]